MDARALFAYTNLPRVTSTLDSNASIIGRDRPGIWRMVGASRNENLKALLDYFDSRAKIPFHS
jgi:hypothetical protein